VTDWRQDHRRRHGVGPAARRTRPARRRASHAASLPRASGRQRTEHLGRAAGRLDRHRHAGPARAPQRNRARRALGLHRTDAGVQRTSARPACGITKAMAAGRCWSSKVRSAKRWVCPTTSRATSRWTKSARSGPRQPSDCPSLTRPGWRRAGSASMASRGTGIRCSSRARSARPGRRFWFLGPRLQAVSGGRPSTGPEGTGLADRCVTGAVCAGAVPQRGLLTDSYGSGAIS